MTKWCLALGTAFFCLATVTASAAEEKPKVGGGIKFNYTRILVENLPIGKKISMTKIANLPIEVTNKFDRPMLVEIDVRKVLNPVEGFEPIPSLRWVTTEYKAITAAAQATVKCDVRIAIPNDKKHLGKKYVVGIAATTSTIEKDNFIEVGYAAMGSLLFSVAPQRNDAALVEIQKHPADSQFEIFPPRIDLWNACAGQKLKVFPEKEKVFELRNLSGKKQTYMLAAIDPASVAIKIDEGAVYSGNPDLVTLGQDEIVLDSNKTEALEMDVEVPAEADLGKNTLAYFVAVGSSVKMGTSKYVSIYVHGGPRPLTLEEAQTQLEEQERANQDSQKP